jgi:multiple sugar transport system permease protein
VNELVPELQKTAVPRRGAARTARRATGTVATTLRHVVVALAMIFFLFPLAWMLIMSLRANAVNTSGQIGIPFVPTLEHYAAIATSVNFMRSLINSVLTSALTMLIALVIGIPSAYGLSRARISWDWALILLPRMLPFIAVVIPWYLLALSAHLLGTIFPISLAALVVSLPILVWSVTSYFSTLPFEMEEAAIVDGAGAIQTLVYVIIPAGLPGIIAGAILAWINAWNIFFFPLILGGASTTTLPVAAAQFVSYGNIDYGGLSAIATLMVAPVLVVTLYLQRYVVAGLVAGAVKG